ncbi:MAG: hypothetical protein HWN66_15505 [Candidatus Helarchaeota archaeon]|nr:hypothetical protein [Candidatus Helarchaeota archaeon]
MAEIPPEERDALLATEAQQVMNEYQTEIVNGSISRMRIYLSITIDKHYVLGIDYSNYPASPPMLTLQEAVKKVVGDPSNFDIIKNWNAENPPHIAEIIREIEGKLYEDNKYWEQERIMSGEFDTKKVAGTSNKFKIRIMTYGLKEYPFIIILRDPPNPPEFELSPEIEQMVGPLENISIYKEWDASTNPIIDLLREISWKIDKHSRLGFEIELLENALKNVTYDPATRKIAAEVKGALKTSDVIFKFAVDIPEDYPASRPSISLLSKVEDDNLAKQMHDSVGNMLELWSPFNFLIDLFNSISKTIFKASVMVCIVCHSLECPICGQSISALEGEESCTATCPHCQKPYHAHCWQKNIESIGKCAYCLRPPPPRAGPPPVTSPPDESSGGEEPDIS